MVVGRVVLVAFVATAVGCSRFRAPGIEVLDTTLVESKGDATRLDVRLDLTNSNDEPLELWEFSYSFAVAGGRPYVGRWAVGRTLPPAGGTQITLPVVVRIAPDVGPEPSWTIRGTALYISPGALAELLFDSEVREPRARFAGGGNVSLVVTDTP